MYSLTYVLVLFILASQTSVSSQQQSQPTRTFGRQSSQTGSIGSVEDYEDTMKNLRKTFAGIFGDDK